jgi:hypothetical protein
MDTVRILILLVVSVAWIGCASGGGGAGTAQDDTAAQTAKSNLPAGYSEPPAGSDLAKVQVGWSENQVRDLLGAPDDANAYMTGKQFNPFYFGGDTSRSDWMYKGKGRVVFSRNRWSGTLKVIRVMYNPKELM